MRTTPASPQPRASWSAPIGRRLAVAALLAVSAGCASIGPPRLARDRVDYAGSLGDSWARQTLLSIVRMRYLETPVFLDVPNIVAGYTVEAGGDVGPATAPPLRALIESLALRGRVADRPTITYKALTGRDFVGAVMTPLVPTTVLVLIQSGWPAHLVLSAAVAEMNGLRNARSALHEAFTADAGFARAVELIERLEAARAITIRSRSGSGDANAQVLAFRPLAGDARPSGEIAELKRLLGLAAEAEDIEIVFGDAPRNDRQLALRTRSIMEILRVAAAEVRVPVADLEQGRVTAGATTATGNDVDSMSAVRGLVVRGGGQPPADALAAARYRGHWYWIDDRDLASKRSFAFLMLVFAMADTGKRDDGPLLTLPTQ